MNKLQKALIKMIAGKRDIVDLAGSQSLFGTLGAKHNAILSKMDFIPENGAGKTITLTGEGDDGTARWIGLDSKEMQFWAYVYCTPLAAVIDRLAEADTNGKIEFVDEETKVKVKNVNKNPKLSRIKKLLKRPNPWQTWEDFEAEQVVFCKIFGYCPVFAVGPVGFDKSYTKALININPIFAKPIENSKFDIFADDSKMISHWEVNFYGISFTMDSSDVILIKDSFISKTKSDLDLPMSKINGMDFFISNILAAMEANNVLLKKKGPLGIFSFDPGKDIAGATPLNPEDKDELQRDLMRYGLTVGQLQYIISKMPIKWNAMSFNLRDLMTKEIIRDGIDGICDRFGYPAELMSGKNATYENRSSSEKFLYQNNIIPFSLRRMTRYNNFFGLEETIIYKNYNHLPVLQDDIVKAGEAEKYQSEALEIEWKSGLITWNEYRVSKGRDQVPGMDIYYNEYIKKFPLMNPNNKQQNSNKDDEETPSEGSGTEE